jgi:hypothetical protein
MEPRKFSGTESWKTSWFTMTRSPTVIVPCATPLQARYIMAVKADEKMMF